MIIDISRISVLEKQHYLQHLIAPRPICFASTVNETGDVNLSPFSFFNLFSIDPPILVFSPSRRVRDNTTKHTLQNAAATKEVVINIVDYDLVQQTSLASCEYAQNINEFEKAGLTMCPSSFVRPPFVKESKASFECRVVDIIALGKNGGAGNLVLCEVLLFHVDESILDEKKQVDQTKLKHVARLGGNWYCKVDSSNLFEVEKPNIKLGIGFDGLPDHIRNSEVLTGNQLAILANSESVPETNDNFKDPTFNNIFHRPNNRLLLHQFAATLINEGNTTDAWQVLLRENTV